MVMKRKRKRVKQALHLGGRKLRRERKPWPPEKRYALYGGTPLGEHKLKGESSGREKGLLVLFEKGKENADEALRNEETGLRSSPEGKEGLSKERRKEGLRECVSAKPGNSPKR